MTDPLSGFVLFENAKEIIQLSIGRGYVRINSEALQKIGEPDYINVFFDECGKRLAVKAADKSMPNTFTMSKASGINKCSVLLERILDVAGIKWHPGEVIRFTGQKYSADYLIFDLSKSKITKYDTSVTKRNQQRKKKAE